MGEVLSGTLSGSVAARRPIRVPAYDVVRYAPQHRRQVVDLLRHLFRVPRPRRRALFQWMYERNPYLEPLLYLARVGKRAVAMRGLWGTKWQAGGQELVIPCATSLVVAPGHRKRGVVRRLMEVVTREVGAEGHRLVINLSARPVTHLASLSQGWRATGSLEDVRRGTVHDHQVLPGGSARLARAWRRVRGYAWRRLTGSRPPFSRFDAAVRERPHPQIAVDRYAWPDAMARLVSRVPYDGRIRHVRDPEYLEWRYQNPLSEYRFLFWLEDGAIDGYLAVGTRRRAHAPEVEAYLVDWEARTAEVRVGLLDALVAWGGFEALAVWAGPFDRPVKDALLRHGFQRTEQGVSITRPPRSVLVRLLADGDAGGWALGDRPLLDAASWDLRMIYSDAF